MVSEQFVDVHGHLVYLCRIVLLDISQNAYVFVSHEIDCDTLSVESSRATDSVNVELSGLR